MFCLSSKGLLLIRLTEGESQVRSPFGVVIKVIDFPPIGLLVLLAGELMESPEAKC